MFCGEVLGEKGMKLKRETAMYLVFAVAVTLSLLFVIPLPKYAEVDFHDGYVQECEEAHKHNMSYCLCSGFWRQPRPEDIPNPVVWHPTEDPNTIPHGSCLGTTDWVITFGIYGWITRPDYYG